jgi:hypothetical protein
MVKNKSYIRLKLNLVCLKCLNLIQFFKKLIILYYFVIFLEIIALVHLWKIISQRQTQSIAYEKFLDNCLIFNYLAQLSQLWRGIRCRNAKKY